MIDWMQKHRKYLVVTIWISTIAFVGAGFVGWGAYSFNKNNSSIAKVGDRFITVKEFQLAYSNAYNNYNNLLGGSLTKEKAKEINLEHVVISNLISEALFLNYADELGFKALDEDIKNQLASEEIFQVDGVFNIEKYKRILQNVQMTPKEYEESLRKSVLLNKIYSLINIPAKKELIEIMGTLSFMKDKVAIQTISVNPNDISINEEELKEFWEPIKDNFKTIKSYEILSEFIPSKDIQVEEKELHEFYEESKFNYTDEEGKIKNFDDAKEQASKALKLQKAKKIALKKYLKIKNKEEKLSKKEIVVDTSTTFPVEQLTVTNDGDVLKPFEFEDGYKIIELVKVNMPQTKSFHEAKEDVALLLKNKKANEELEKKAKTLLENFNGKDVGFISRELNEALNGLTLQESLAFVNQMFDSNKLKSFVILGNKAVVYSILEQKLLDENKTKEHNEELTKMAMDLQNSQLQNQLLTQLQKHYKIEQYYKGQ